MNPVCFTIGSRPIYWYGVTMALAFLAGMGHWTLLARREGRDVSLAGDLAFWIMLAGIVGARAAHVASEWSYYRTVPSEIVRVDQGGMTFYGGFILAAVAVVVFARARRLPFLDLCDFVVTALPLGHALGRVGCFLNVCCYGKLTTGALGICYPAHFTTALGETMDNPVWAAQVRAGLLPKLAPASLPVHPVQLYEAGFNLLVYALLTVFYLRGRRGRHGLVLAAYLILYPPGRFLLEYLRGDERLQVGVLDGAQALSLAFMAVGAALWFWISRRHENAPHAA